MYNFFIENGNVNFYGNRDLEKIVGLGEIVPNESEFKYLKVNGILCKRVDGLREYYEDQNGKYRIILDNYKVQPISSEEGAKVKFPSDEDGNNLFEKQMQFLSQTNEMIYAKIKTDPDYKISKQSFLKLLESE